MSFCLPDSPLNAREPFHDRKRRAVAQALLTSGMSAAGLEAALRTPHCSGKLARG